MTMHSRIDDYVATHMAMQRCATSIQFGKANADLAADKASAARTPKCRELAATLELALALATRLAICLEADLRNAVAEAKWEERQQQWRCGQQQVHIGDDGERLIMCEFEVTAVDPDGTETSAHICRSWADVEQALSELSANQHWSVKFSSVAVHRQIKRRQP